MVVLVRLLWIEGHRELYCNLTCHFSEYHGCLVHFQFPTSNSSLSQISIYNSMFLSNCMVLGVLQLSKILLSITTLHIFTKLLFFVYKRDVRNKLLGHSILIVLEWVIENYSK